MISGPIMAPYCGRREGDDEPACKRMKHQIVDGWMCGRGRYYRGSLFTTSRDGAVRELLRGLWREIIPASIGGDARQEHFGWLLIELVFGDGWDKSRLTEKDVYCLIGAFKLYAELVKDPGVYRGIPELPPIRELREDTPERLAALCNG